MIPVEFPTFKFILSDGVDTWELPQAPDGWEASFIEWQRAITTYGIIRNYSIPLKWTLDGAFFLRNSFYKRGIQAYTSIVIQKLIPASLTYVNFYEGTIDYSSFSDTNVFVEVNIMDSGMAEKINAYKNTKYEIDLYSDPDTEEIQFNGIELREQSSVTGFSIEPNALGVVPELTFTINEQVVSSTPLKDVAQFNYYPGDEPYLNPTDDHYFFLSNETHNTTFSGTIEGRIEEQGFVAGIPKAYAIYLRIGSATATLHTINYTTTGTPMSVPYSFVVNITNLILPGEKVYLYSQRIPFSAPLTASQELYFDEILLNVSYNVIFEPTTAKALRADKLFERLIHKISGIPNQTQTHLLETDYSSMYYTSGDAIRRLEGSTIKITLSDFIKDWFGIACAGLGVENEKAVLERRDYFFRKNQKIDSLGVVQNAVFEVAEDLVFNTIKTGSPNQSIDELNGRFEVNSEVQWTTPITRITQEYDILTASRTDAYGIELTRINLEGKDTTDANSDNSAFIIDTVNDGVLRASVASDRYLSASGVPAVDTVYNLYLSPKQNLLRHNYFIISFLWGSEDGFITWRSALKDKNLVTTDFNGVTVTESQNIYIKTLGDKLFYPITAKITTKYAKNLVSLINNTPYGYLEFTWYDNTYRGYILEASFNPANYEEKEFTLLLTPDNNILSLIR